MSDTRPEFDLRPDPRILPMLGEITLAQWRCVAELIDNSVDGFLAAARRDSPIDSPEVTVNIPTTDSQAARITIRDNGPGMPPDVLEQAVRAGWTGNSPVGNLGMFGMGFNIATARLGTVTTVWTATPADGNWHGLKIDFDQLRVQRHFRTPHLTRPKADPAEHGTEVTIEHLKPEQRAWLTRPANLSQVRQHLGEAYAAMLRQNGIPLSFQLTLNGRRVLAKNHCVWDDSRIVETSRWGPIPAVISIDRHLPNRPFCLSCWQWLVAGDGACPACGTATSVVQRDRHVHGWIGLQRYLSTSEFGIDFVRNGRKIEIANTELFQWRHDGAPEPEYPIDDPRNRGRFVGEIHLDHCRVTYTKDRFDRSDPAWEEMVGIVRGEGPLRPEKAAEAGFGPNESPLFRLYQAFRRSSPPNARLAGGWAKVLVVKDNDRAEEMAKRFHKGEPDYQTDAKWWELVLEEDNRLLTPTSPAPAPAGGGPTPSGPRLPGFSGGPATPTPGGSGPVPPAPAPAPPRAAIPSLTREYRHEGTNLRWDVRAFEVQSSDPDLGAEAPPWRMIRRPTGEEEFLVNSGHAIFRSATMTELDALLCHLAWSAMDFTRGQATAPAFPVVLAELRDRYAGPLKLDALSLKSQADQLFAAIAKAWPRGMDPNDCTALFNDELSKEQQDAVFNKMAIRGVGNPQDLVRQGRFLEYGAPRTLVAFVVSHPELFFDGKCWEDAYADLEYPVASATDEARSRVLRYFESLLLDVVWLIEREADDLTIAPRERVLRSALALELLVPADSEG